MLTVLAAFLVCVAGGLGPLGCEQDEPAEVDDRVAVKLSFDEAVYVDAAFSQHRVLERIKNEARSLFPALRKADVLLLTNQQVDVEPAQLKREPVTVVDPATGVTRAALRVRYHYVALAQVPKALADKSELALGVLHASDRSKTDAVLTACTANGEREKQAVAELWTVFDPALPSCAEAMAREQADITAARKQLKHPDREILPSELTRLYLPETVHVRRRQAANGGNADGGGELALPTEGQHAEDPTVRIHGAGGPVGDMAPAAPAAEGDEPAVVYVDKSREKEFEESEDEAELRRQARSLSSDQPGATNGAPITYAYSSSPYLQPNYAILYVAIVAFVVLLAGNRRRKKH